MGKVFEVLNPVNHVKAAVAAVETVHTVATAPVRILEDVTLKVAQEAARTVAGDDAARVLGALQEAKRQAEDQAQKAAAEAAVKAAETAKKAEEEATRLAAQAAAEAARATAQATAAAVQAVGAVHAELAGHIPGIGETLKDALRVETAIASNAIQASGAVAGATVQAAAQFDIEIKNGDLAGAAGAITDATAAAMFDTVLLPAVMTHRDLLRAQAAGKWKTLPAELIDIIKTDYAVDLTKVRYAEHIPATFSRTTITTYENEIFFPGSVNLRERSNLLIMLHELQHVVQCEAVGGLVKFLQAYFRDAIKTVGMGHILRDGKLNVHDNMDLERECDEKAERLIVRVNAAYNPPVIQAPPIAADQETDVAQPYQAVTNRM